MTEELKKKVNVSLACPNCGALINISGAMKVEPITREHKDIVNDILQIFAQELRELEIEGFVRGEKERKTMDVPMWVVCDSLKKQWQDWEKARLSSKPEKIKRALADLRNVAGCVFLKLQEARR